MPNSRTGIIWDKIAGVYKLAKLNLIYFFPKCEFIGRCEGGEVQLYFDIASVGKFCIFNCLTSLFSF